MEKITTKTKKEKTVPIKGEPFTSYQIFIIVIMALLQFTVVLDFMILAPLGDMLMKNLGMTTKQFGTVVSAYAISAGISGILAAGFADKFDRKKLLLFFYVGFTVGTLFCGLANSYQTLFYARMITGIFGGVIAAISMAIITDLFTLNQRGRVMGFVQMSFAASQILGLPIGLELATRWGWHSTFFMIVGLAVIMGITLVLKLKPITEHLKTKSKKNAIQHLWNTIQKRDYRIGFLATAMLSLGGFMIMPFTSAFLVNNVGILQGDLSIIYLFTGLASIIIMPIVGKLSDRIDKFRLFTIGTLVACCMVLVYTNLSVTPIWVVIVINMVLFMGIMSRIVPATALNSAIPEMYDRGAFMSINSSLQQMSGGVAAIIAGLIVYQPTKTSPIENFDVIGYIMAFTFILCIYLMYRVSKMIKKRTVEPVVAAEEITIEV
ncbi:MFS transporter [Aurantibacillus circumpalustris]|uniref:MFS transporter n=1 Tax=Aurantibacillus circumpalustris TaxID=3036359 RepID=UPI00295A57B9|nr:MFS transporter [Aurantibacillus circumpalustris]